MKEKALTELQSRFLFYLFGEAEMDPHVAKQMAGYSSATTLKEVTEGLKDEIHEHMKSYLAIHGPLAVYEMVKALKESTPNGNKLKAIEMVLNRIGLSDKQDGVDFKVPEGGLFILPAKKVREYKVMETEVENEEITSA